MFINGQRATAMADGMAISWQEAMNRINSEMIAGELGLTQNLISN